MLALFFAGSILLSLSGVASAIVVNPGESIQAAIDSLPPEGGMLELAAGTHILPANTTINITKPNVTLKGQGKTSTILDGSGSNNLKIRVGTEPPNLTLPISNYLDNITISDFYIKGGSGSNDIAIRLFNAKNYTISNMEINAVYYAIIGTLVDSGSISDNYLHNTLGSAILGQQMSKTDINHNIFENIGGGVQFNRQSAWGNLEFAGEYNTIDSNSIYNSLTNNGSIYLYSTTTNTIVKNNLITYSNGATFGIMIYGGGWHKIHDNRIYKSGSSTYGLIEVKPDTINNDIYRNVLIGNSSSECINIKYSTPPGGNYKSPTNINIINNVLSGCKDGFSDSYNSTGIFKNNIVVNNSGYGINLSLSNFVVSYNDVWNNTLGNYNGVSAGTGDLSQDPLFADASAADFHLKSQYGRYTSTGWVTDTVTSAAIDAGDPTSDYSLEPQPNGGRINIGAYGNTVEASKSQSYVIDLDGNGVINILDIVIVAQHFGESTASPYLSYDINSDGSVDILDIRLVAEGM